MSIQPEIVHRVYAAKKDLSAAEDLILDYIPFIKSETAKAIGRAPIEGNDDELSIAMIGFHEAIETYSKERGAFVSFASLVIKRRIADHHRRENRFRAEVSLSATVSEDEEISIADTLESPERPHDDINEREAVKAEIAELSEQLKSFDIILSDVATNCPKQDRTMEACKNVLGFARSNPEIIQTLKDTKKLPISIISKGTGVDRKTMDRHRKYIVTLLLIYSNGYESIRGHLKQVFNTEKGGAEA